MPRTQKLRWSFSLRTLLATVAVVALSCGLLSWGWYRYMTSVYVAYVLNVESTFQTMPSDDQELHDWLQAQPGVIPQSVHLERATDTTLSVHFLMVRNKAGQPEIPKLTKKCNDLGYTGGNGVFRDLVRGAILPN